MASIGRGGRSGGDAADDENEWGFDADKFMWIQERMKAREGRRRKPGTLEFAKKKEEEEKEKGKKEIKEKNKERNEKERKAQQKKEEEIKKKYKEKRKGEKEDEEKKEEERLEKLAEKEEEKKKKKDEEEEENNKRVKEYKKMLAKQKKEQMKLLMKIKNGPNETNETVDKQKNLDPSLLKKQNINKKSLSIDMKDDILKCLIQNELEKVKYFVQNHTPEVYKKDRLKNNVLHLCCRYDHVQALDIVLPYMKSQHFNAQNNDGNTPILIAILTNHIDPLRILLSQSIICDLDLKNSHGRTALTEAIFHQLPSFVQLLLDYKNPPNIEIRDKGNRTPLYWAVRQNHIPIFKLLVQKNANLFVRDDRGKTLVDEAKGHILRLLLYHMYLLCSSALSSSSLPSSLFVVPDIFDIITSFAYGSQAKVMPTTPKTNTNNSRGRGAARGAARGRGRGRGRGN